MFLVMTIKEGVPNQNHLLTSNRKRAEDKYLELCHEVEAEDSDDVLLDDGYYELSGASGSSISINDLSNTEGHDDASRIVVEVDGGCVQQVWGDDTVAMIVLDWDNLKSGDRFDFDPTNPENGLHGPAQSFEDFLKSDSLSEALDRNERNKE